MNKHKNPLELEITQRMAPAHAVWEGDRLVAYLCPAGFLTVGRGHNCEARPVPGVAKVGDRIIRETLERLYAEDCQRVFVDMDFYFPWWRGMCAPRGAALFDMVFNMGVGRPPRTDAKGSYIPGTGVRSFGNTLRAMQHGDFTAAANGMMSSLWARQVGDGPGGRKDRAEMMSIQMRTGKWAI